MKIIETLFLSAYFIFEWTQKSFVYGISWIEITIESLEQASAVGVLTVLDFKIPCFRPETPVLYLRILLPTTKAVDENNNTHDDFRDGNESSKIQPVVRNYW